MLLVVDVPDREGDAVAGKRTLVVRLGVDATAHVHNVALFGAYALLPLLMEFGLPGVVVLSFLCTAPLAVVRVLAAARGPLRDPRRWEAMAFCAVVLVFVGTIAELVGFAFVAAKDSADVLIHAAVPDGTSADGRYQPMF